MEREEVPLQNGEMMSVNLIQETTWECISCTKIMTEEDVMNSHSQQCRNVNQCEPIIIPHTKHYKTRTFSNPARLKKSKSHRGRHRFGSLVCDKCGKPMETRKHQKLHMYTAHSY